MRSDPGSGSGLLGGLRKSSFYIVDPGERADDERLLSSLKEGRRKPAERPTFPRSGRTFRLASFSCHSARPCGGDEATSAAADPVIDFAGFGHHLVAPEFTTGCRLLASFADKQRKVALRSFPDIVANSAAKDSPVIRSTHHYV